MLIRRLLAAVDAAATASSNASACEADCTAILANSSMICLDDDLLSPIAADCLDNDEGSGIFGSYLILWRCGVHQSPLALLFLVPWLLMLLMALGSTADNFLMPQLHYLSELLRLSPDVAGVTLLAVGNGAPDVFSAIAVATANANKKMDLSFMLSDIVGGSLFIMTIVVGSVVWIAGTRAPGWSVGKLPFWRDSLMLLIAATTVLKVANDGVIYTWEALSFLGLHATYICLVLLLPRVQSRLPARVAYVLELPLSLLRWLSIPSSDGQWDRRRRLWTACTPPLAALLFSLEVYDDVPGALGATIGESGVPMVAALLGGGLVLSLLVLACSGDKEAPRWTPLLVVIGFVMTVVWLDLVANEMIALIETIGHILNVSTSILGLTVIAIGNSIGDFVADTAAAREGSVAGTRMAIAACFGSPVIMNIVSVGLSFSLRLLITRGAPIHYARLSRLARLGYLLFYVTVVSHLVVFPLCGYRAPRLYALYLFAIYGTLIGLSIVIELSPRGGALGGAWLCEGLFVTVFGACDEGCEG